MTDRKHFTHDQVHDFMRVLYEVQDKIKAKYGRDIIWKWRLKRLDRMGEFDVDVS